MYARTMTKVKRKGNQCILNDSPKHENPPSLEVQ